MTDKEKLELALKLLQLALLQVDRLMQTWYDGHERELKSLGLKFRWELEDGQAHS